jgi:hypothetical protein
MNRKTKIDFRLRWNNNKASLKAQTKKMRIIIGFFQTLPLVIRSFPVIKVNTIPPTAQTKPITKLMKLHFKSLIILIKA